MPIFVVAFPLTAACASAAGTAGTAGSWRSHASDADFVRAVLAGVVMGTLGGFPCPPATLRCRQSRQTPHAYGRHRRILRGPCIPACTHAAMGADRPVPAAFPDGLRPQARQCRAGGFHQRHHLRPAPPRPEAQVAWSAADRQPHRRAALRFIVEPERPLPHRRDGRRVRTANRWRHAVPPATSPQRRGRCARDQVCMSQGHALLAAPQEPRRRPAADA